MADLGSLLRAGGIIPIDAEAPRDERCGEVVAHEYEHPLLPDRKIVRLSVSAVAPGADAEMDALGFERGAVVARLGLQRFRALGFPGWALVNDPKHASFALQVTRDFKQAKKRVRSKPGHARDAFATIAELLARSVPHFLPSFWEEAGRAFLEEDSAAFAAQCFEKARLVEKEHKLPIDEDVRSAVYLEFALSGALAAKSLSGYAKELERRYGAEVAYARYRELALRRTLGGLAPWSGMGKELRSLASAAKLDVAQEQMAFVREVLSSPAIQRAPGDFWQLYRPALVALAKVDAAVRTRLRHLFPAPNSGAGGFSAFWLELVEEADLLAALLTRSDEEPEPDAAAKWLHALIVFREGDASLRRYFEQFRARLAEAKLPLDLARGRVIALPLAEHAAKLGIAIAEPASHVELSLDVIDCDPVHVAAHPLLRGLLVAAVADRIGGVAFEAAAVGKQGFVEARRAWLAGELEKLEHGTLVSFEQALTTLAKKSTARLFAEFPDLYARLASLHAGPALARTLRGGLFAELSWPAWEQAVAELGLGPNTRVGGFFPYPVLSNSVKAIVLHGQRRLAEHDFVLPAGSRANAVCWLDGQFLVLLHGPGGARAYWSGTPAQVFEFSGSLYSYSSDLNAAVAAQDGGLQTAHGTVHAGSQKLELGNLVSDGQTFWKSEWHELHTRLVELDPKTGQTGRASWPAFVAPLSELSDGLRLHSVWMAPLPQGAEESPLGHKDGVCGFAVRTSERARWEVTGVDGRKASATSPIEALALFPGDTRVRMLQSNRFWRTGETRYGVTLFDADGLALGTYGETSWASHGFGAGVPLSCWHFFTVRDPRGSSALRAISDETASLLLGGDEATTQKRMKASLPEVSASALREALLAATLEATRLERELGQLVAERSPARAGEIDEGVLSDTEVSSALGVLGQVRWSSGHWTPEVNAVGRFLSGTETSIPEASQHAWETWLGSLRALAVLAALPSTEPAAREQLRRVLSTLRHSGLCSDVSNLRLLTGRYKPSSTSAASDATLLSRHGENRYFTRGLNRYHTAGDVPVRILERAPNAAFRVPDDVSVESELRFRERGDATWLDAFLALSDTPGPVNEAIGKELIVAERTGLTRAESSLLLFGLGKLNSYDNDLLGKELRESLALKVAEIKVARDAFRDLSELDWLRLLDAAAPEDPRDLLDLQQLARRLADAWVSAHGKRVALRDELVVTVERELDPSVKSSELLAAALAPNESPLLQFQKTSLDDLFGWQQPADRFLGPAIRGFAHLLAWGFGALPVGDEYRDGLVQLHERALAGLTNPELLLPLQGTAVSPENGDQLRTLFDALGGELSRQSEDKTTHAFRDTGLLLARLSINEYSLQLDAAVRTARCPDLEGQRLLWQLDSGTGASGLACAAYLQSAACARLVARIRVTPVPRGGFENNPALSAPDAVRHARERHGLAEDPAMLYLQILALAEPSNKNVLIWNGWKPAQLKRAGAELLEKDLVVEGKRERAGREWFLPGAWEKGVGKALPMEAWKKPLYQLPQGCFARTLAPVPSHELFATALRRIEQGDLPKLEEV